jgi:hypothetical protein
MAKYQLITGFVNLGGNRDNVVFRGEDNPMTYPETIILAAMHGGPEHVHGLVAIGEKTATPEEELTRLTQTYKAIAAEVFPVIAGRAALPESDPNLPTPDEVAAGEAAKAEAMTKVRKGGKSASKTVEPATPAPDAPAVPSLADLPK